MKRLADKPFVLLGVNSDKDRSALKKTIAEERITWRSWWDEGRIDGPIHAPVITHVYRPPVAMRKIVTRGMEQVAVEDRSRSRLTDDRHWLGMAF